MDGNFNRWKDLAETLVQAIRRWEIDPNSSFDDAGVTRAIFDIEADLKSAQNINATQVTCFECQPVWSGIVAFQLPPRPTCSKCGKPCTGGHWINTK